MPPFAAAGFSAFFAAALAAFCGPLPAAMLAILCAAAFVGTLLLVKNEAYPYKKLLLFALAAAALSMGRSAWVVSRRLQPALAYAGSSWQVEGQITDILSQDGSVRYTLSASLPGSGLSSTVRIQLWASSDLAAGKLGETVRGAAYFYSTAEQSHWEQALRAASGVMLRGKLVSGDFFQSEKLLPETVFSQLRRRLSRSIAYALPDQRGALVSAVLCGDRSRLASELQWDIQRSGLSHLLAISGFHLSVVVSMLRLLMCRRRPTVRSAVCLLGILAYALLTGAPFSVQRAAIMWSLMLLSEALFRRYDGVNALGLALLALTLVNPLSAASLSLWYSGAATLAILLFAGPLANHLAQKLGLLPAPKAEGGWKEHGRRAAAALLRSLCASIAACAAVLPISWIAGNAISLLSPISTLAAGLLLTPMVVGGFLTGAAAGLPILSRCIAWLTGIFAGLLQGLIRLLGDLPFAVVPTGLSWLAVWFVGLAVSACVCVRRRREPAILLSAALWCVLSFSLSLLGYQLLTAELTRVVIPAGSNCALISRGRTHFLIGDIRSSQEGEAVASALLDYGIGRLQLAILGGRVNAGLEPVCREADISVICAPNFPDSQAFLQYAGQYLPLSPSTLSMGDLLSIEILALPGDTGYAACAKLDGAGLLIFLPNCDIMEDAMTLDIYPRHQLVMLPASQAEGIDHLPSDYNIVTSGTAAYNLYHAPRAAQMVHAQEENAVFTIRGGSVRLLS